MEGVKQTMNIIHQSHLRDMNRVNQTMNIIHQSHSRDMEESHKPQISFISHIQGSWNFGRSQTNHEYHSSVTFKGHERGQTNHGYNQSSVTIQGSWKGSNRPITSNISHNHIQGSWKESKKPTSLVSQI